MAMGKRKGERQQEMWVETESLPSSPGHCIDLSSLQTEGIVDFILNAFRNSHRVGLAIQVSQ